MSADHLSPFCSNKKIIDEQYPLDNKNLPSLRKRSSIGTLLKKNKNQDSTPRGVDKRERLVF